MTVYSFTGHRPSSLGGYGEEISTALDWFAFDLVLSLKRSNQAPMEKGVVGMALGWDTAVAKACVTLNIPFIAAVPFPGQQKRWPARAQDVHARLLKSAAEVVYVTPEAPPKKSLVVRAMMKRNEWMVDNSERLVALWNGDHGGGTAACVRYSRKKHERQNINVWKRWQNEMLLVGI